MLFAVVVVLVVIGAGLYFALNATSTQTPPPRIIPPGELPPPEEAPQVHQIRITSAGFIPSVITIKRGDRVTWTNEGTSAAWPASAVHPSHTVYPGSGITKCGTAQESMIFDACRGRAQEATYTFTFNEEGSWRYHDHLAPTRTGTVVVQ